MALMKPKKRQKLCYNCDGDVDLDVIVCPFCAADLREEKPELQRSAFSASVSSVKQLNTEQSLYPPPYSERMEVEREPLPTAVMQEEPEPTVLKTDFLPMALFIMGAHLALLAITLLAFSERGVMILKWDARFWLLYLIAAVPLLVYGYRKL